MEEILLIIIPLMNLTTLKTISIYYFERPIRKIEFDFEDKQYQVQLQLEPSYVDVINRYKLAASYPIFNFDKIEGVTGHHVIYKGLKRTLTVKFYDIFEETTEYKYTINEELIRKIIKGTADSDDVTKLIEEFNLSDPKYLFRMKKPGNHTSLNDENLLGCVSLEVNDKITAIKIQKNVKFEVTFEVLTEHIKINSQEKYKFIFRVLDFDSDKYIENLKLKAEWEYIIDDKIFSQDFNVIYNSDNATYEFELELYKIKEFIKEYWDNSQHSLYKSKLFIKDLNTGNILRPLPLTIVNK
jgi:hypothetical protein